MGVDTNNFYILLLLLLAVLLNSYFKITKIIIATTFIWKVCLFLFRMICEQGHLFIWCLSHLYYFVSKARQRMYIRFLPPIFPTATTLSRVGSNLLLCPMNIKQGSAQAHLLWLKGSSWAVNFVLPNVPVQINPAYHF